LKKRNAAVKDACMLYREKLPFIDDVLNTFDGKKQPELSHGKQGDG